MAYSDVTTTRIDKGLFESAPDHRPALVHGRVNLRTFLIACLVLGALVFPAITSPSSL